jgi:5-methylcytosine-specific restriction enzyme B
MQFPQNISKDHLMRAIAKIESDGVPPDGQSRYYDVVYNSKKYPPKVIISYANFFANGTLLDRKAFTGGMNTQAFKLLEANGFRIERKMETFYEQLVKFIDQSKTGNLKTSGTYQGEYMGLSVKVSFGQGNPAQIPWIAFLKGNQTVSNGIYPVYLYYKKIGKLILAFGLSETKRPELVWPEENLKEIKTFFAENNLGKPERYGNSYVFRVYDLNKSLNQKQIDSDLSKIIEMYDDAVPMMGDDRSTDRIVEFSYKSFFAKCMEAGLQITEMLCLRYASSLLTKPFVILTGLSGSGKTKLALAFADWICQSQEQVCIVPVGADWTNREPLLGYPNALDQGRYVLPESGALQLLIRASKDQNKPYFLILDEMNLSHVERYFADFLSVMETGKHISLHPGPMETADGIPASLIIPTNVFIIGTVNIDETTYMFSPKVLDRANVIEFRITLDEMKQFLQDSKGLELRKLQAAGVDMAPRFLDIKSATQNESLEVEIANTLIDFFAILQQTGAEFGYRTASEVSRLATTMRLLKPEADTSEIIDVLLMQKLLPKVHGSRRKLEPILKNIGSLCLPENASVEDILSSKAPTSIGKFPITLTKVKRMYDNLMENGFTSFAEA